MCSDYVAQFNDGEGIVFTEVKDFVKKHYEDDIKSLEKDPDELDKYLEKIIGMYDTFSPAILKQVRPLAIRIYFQICPPRGLVLVSFRVDYIALILLLVSLPLNLCR